MIDLKRPKSGAFHPAMRQRPCDDTASRIEKRRKSVTFDNRPDRQQIGLIDPDRHHLADQAARIFPADPGPPRDQHPSIAGTRINAPYFIRGGGPARIDGKDHGSVT
ncbi:hypothetical protein [Sphingobium indicum]